MDAIFGSIMFEFIGAFFRWLFYVVISKVKGKKIVGFKRVWQGRKNAEFRELMSQGFSNIILGMVIVVGVIVILKLVGV